MGYNGISLIKGAQFKGGQFITIGKDGTLGDLKITGYEDPAGPFEGVYWQAGICVSKINEFGVNYKDLYWWDVDGFYGWYEEGDPSEETCANSIPYAAGETLWIQVSQDDSVGLCLQSAGEVSMSGVAVTLVKGAQFLNAACPRETTMGEIRITGYEDPAGPFEGVYWQAGICASKINEFGVNYKDVYWWDVDGWYGWYEEGDPSEETDANDIKLPAGEGLWVQVSQDDSVGLTMVLPPAIKVVD